MNNHNDNPWAGVPPDDEPPNERTPEQDEDFIGYFPSVRDLAEHLLAQTGIHEAIDRAIELCGESLRPYINIDIDRYASDLASDVHMLPTGAGDYEIYWRTTEG